MFKWNLLFLTVSTAFTLFWFSPGPGFEASPVGAIASSLTGHYRIEIHNGQPLGPTVLRVQQGSALKIDLLSDVTDAVHLHGYNQHLELAAGQIATLEVLAKHSGRFELELHERNLQLAVLEVYPGEHL